MRDIRVEINGFEFKRINKQKARKAFDNGLIVVLTPCKMNPHFIGAAWYETNRNHVTHDFDKMVNAFEYYNCIEEVGRYASYFIPVRKNDFDGMEEYDYNFLQK